jgi:DNA-directed RNA polymerase subunit RPC12/RpoP
MRITSLYVSTCHVCGAAIESPTPDAKCPGCGVKVRLDWPARPPVKVEREK